MSEPFWLPYERHREEVDREDSRRAKRHDLITEFQGCLSKEEAIDCV